MSRSRSRTRSKSALKYENVKIRLVERGSQEMHICWKYSIMSTLTVIVALSFLTAYSFLSMMRNYKTDEFCYISVHHSVWGMYRICDYLGYAPLLMALVAMFWIEMFYLCGRGGYTDKDDHIDHRPWRIVLPALLWFLVCIIFEISYIIVLQGHLTRICKDLEESSFENWGKDCEYLILSNSYDPDAPFYQMLTYSSVLSMLLWSVVTGIMVARVILVPDFKVVLIKDTKVEPVSPTTEHILCENNSKERLIFLNSEASSRSVHFKSFSE